MAANGQAAYTTVSNWWAPESAGKWVSFQGEAYHNEKRTSFLEYIDLPLQVPARLELMLGVGKSDPDGPFLAERNWSVRRSADVCATPEAYRRYIQGSRGEFSCVKPSCLRFQNAWISDRTLCYLASGKPAIVQHTGPSRFLPDAEGLFRFRTPDEAAGAIRSVEAGYERQSRLARALAEEYFDARKVTAAVLEKALA
jgi:glycosyltransferase involved in cell wall biosynthesis